ncbi:rho GTPase-activating protein 26-like isoform X3 [Osmerus mordax]|uniref:rho GTPase-activating protein 26-like isoform X3 n=1 Tax=Osmerus mordax TaxID=8014 RepID=UPI00350FAA88
MTYQYQRSFIKAAKLDNPEARVTEIHSIVHRLPEKNRQMLELLTQHLANVASHHPQNLMTVANLGVVFGPTLLRPQEETVAAIMDIKFQNIVVEILIENHERIFRDTPGVGGGQAPQQVDPTRRRSGESKAASCSERPLTLFHTPTHSKKVEKRNSVGVNSVSEPPAPSQDSQSSSSVHCNNSSSSSRSRTPRNSLTSNDGDPDTRPSQNRPNSLLNPKSRPAIPTSGPGRKARALYACKAEHDSELSFIAGTIFENVHPSREPGWLEGTLDGRTGLIPENYVEFV